MQHRTFVAVFAPILLPTLSIMSVFHDVHAVTAAASVCDDFLYHHNVLTHHFLFYHYPTERVRLSWPVWKAAKK
ncbi:MAG: hypothetical protein ACTFAK_09780 [Candidatus Electronema sp. VV]